MLPERTGSRAAPEPVEARAAAAARADPLLALQRTAGNRAVGRMLQRQIRVPGRVISSANVASFQAGLQAALAAVAKKKAWPKPFTEQVDARMTELINDATIYPATGRFESYMAFVQFVAKEVTAKSLSAVATSGEKLPALDPWPVEHAPMDIDPEQASLLGYIHDEASEYREFGGDVPEEFGIGAERRAYQKVGALDPSQAQQVGIGGYVGEVRGHGSVVTNVGGGRGAEYAELFETFSLALQLRGTTEAQAATDILAMLHGNAAALLGYSNFALIPLDQVLTILAGAESARATGAVIHFAATIYHVAQGGSTFKAAFWGPAAVFLGANEGGAQALRHATPSSLVGQETRARDAAERYLAAWGGSVQPATLAAQLQTNISSYSRKRKG